MSDRRKLARVYRWDPTLPAGRVLFWLLVGFGVLSVVMALVELPAALSATSITDTWPAVFQHAFHGFFSPLAFATGPLALACEVLWLIWQHKVHGDLFARGVPGLRFTPGWAVGWWFVPFASFVQPFRSVRELSRHAGRTAPPGPGERPAVSDGMLVAWWSTYLAYGFLSVAVIAIWFVALWPTIQHTVTPTTVVTIQASTLRAVARWWAASDLVRAAAAFLAAAVVLRISQAEDSVRDVAASLVPPRPDIW